MFQSFCRWKVEAQKGPDSCSVATQLGSSLTFSGEHSWLYPESPSGAGSLGSDPIVSGKTVVRVQTGWLLAREDWCWAVPLRTPVDSGARGSL